MAKKSGNKLAVHQWIIRIAVILAIPFIYMSDAFGLADDAYRMSIFLILAVIAGIGLILLKRFGQMIYIATFGFVVFTYVFNLFQAGSIEVIDIGYDLISPYFLIPLLFGVYLFTSPVQKLFR